MSLSNYKELSKYISLYEYENSSDPLSLYKEERNLFAELLIKSADNKEIETVILSLAFSKFKRVMENKATDAEFKYIKDFKAENINKLWDRTVKTETFEKVLPFFYRYNEYYLANENRNEEFADRIIKGINKEKPVTAVITGGFHTEELKQILLSKGLSVSVLTPKINTETKSAERKYVKLLNEQVKAQVSEAKLDAYALAQYIKTGDSADLMKTLLEIRELHKSGVFGNRSIEEIINQIVEVYNKENEIKIKVSSSAKEEFVINAGGKQYNLSMKGKSVNIYEIVLPNELKSKIPPAAIFYKLGLKLKAENPIVNFISNPFTSPAWETAYLAILSLINPVTGYLAFFTSHIIADTLILKEGETRADAFKKSVKAHINPKFIIGTFFISLPFMVLSFVSFGIIPLVAAMAFSFIIHKGYNALAVKYGFTPASVLTLIAEPRIGDIIDSYIKTAPEVKRELLVEFAKYLSAKDLREFQSIIEKNGKEKWFQETFSTKYFISSLTMNGLRKIKIIMTSALKAEISDNLADFAKYNNKISNAELQNIVDEYGKEKWFIDLFSGKYPLNKLNARAIRKLREFVYVHGMERINKLIYLITKEEEHNDLAVQYIHKYIVPEEFWKKDNSKEKLTLTSKKSLILTSLISKLPQTLFRYADKAENVILVTPHVIPQSEASEILDLFKPSKSGEISFLDYNAKALRLLNAANNRDELKAILVYVEEMIKVMSLLSSSEADRCRRTVDNFNEILKKEKDFSEIKDSLHDLINDVHQRGENEFPRTMEKLVLETENKESKVYSRFTNLDDDIKFINLSENGEINLEILKALRTLMAGHYRIALLYKNIYIKDSTLFWTFHIGRHNVSLLADFSESDRKISISYYEGARWHGNKMRLNYIEEVLKQLGFNSIIKEDGDKVINIGLQARLDKDTGLNEDKDLSYILAQAISLFQNSLNMDLDTLNVGWLVAQPGGGAAMYSGANLETVSFLAIKFFSGKLRELIEASDGGRGLAAYNHMLIGFDAPLFDEARQRLNPVLTGLGLDKIPDKLEKKYDDNLQLVMDKYLNEPLEEAYAKGKIILNTNGQLEKNKNYDIAVEIANDLHSDNKTVLFEAGSVINQMISKRYFNLCTEAKFGGQHTLKAGYIQLINGDYLSVKLIESKGRTVKAVKAELVSDRGRETLDSKKLTDILKEEGYQKDLETENISESEQASFIEALKKEIETTKNPSAQALVTSKGNGMFAGEILIDPDRSKIKKILKDNPEKAKKIIWIAPYTTPDDMEIIDKVGAVVTLGGGVNSHAAISTREIEKMSMAIKAALQNGEIKIESVKLKGIPRSINGIRCQDGEGITITLKDGDKMLLNSGLGTIEILDTGENLEQYNKNTGDAIRISGAEIKPQKEIKPKKPSEELKISEMVKTFGELRDEDKDRTGSKGWNLAKMLQSVFNNGENTIPDGITVNQDGIRYYLGEKAARYDVLIQEIKNIIADKNLNDKNKKDGIEPLRNEIIELIKKGGRAKELTDAVLLKMRKSGIKIAAVRSSGIGEDGQTRAFAGMGESRLKIKRKNVPGAIAECFEAFYSDRAIEDMIRNAVTVEPALVIQEWVDFAKSGVAMADGDIIVIEGAYGECSAIVSGRITPDRIVLKVTDYEKGKFEIIEYETSDKDYKVETNENGKSNLVKVTEGRKKRIYGEEELKKAVIAIGKIKDKLGLPDPDVEFGFDKNNNLKVVQARANTSAKKTGDEPKTETVEDIINAYGKEPPEIRPGLLAEFARNNKLTNKELRNIIGKYGSVEWFQELFSGRYSLAGLTKLTVKAMEKIGYLYSGLEMDKTDAGLMKQKGTAQVSDVQRLIAFVIDTDQDDELKIQNTHEYIMPDRFWKETTVFEKELKLTSLISKLSKENANKTGDYIFAAPKYVTVESSKMQEVDEVFNSFIAFLNYNENALYLLNHVDNNDDLEEVLGCVKSMAGLILPLNSKEYQECLRKCDKFINIGEKEGFTRIKYSLEELINFVHQTGEKEFFRVLRSFTYEMSDRKNAHFDFLSFDGKNIKFINLSKGGEINPEILKTFKILMTSPYKYYLDKIILKDNMLVWSFKFVKHSVFLAANFGESDRGISISYYESEDDKGRRIRLEYVKKVLKEGLGFNVINDDKVIKYDSGEKEINVGLKAKLDKDTGLNENDDLPYILAHAMMLFPKVLWLDSYFYHNPENIDLVIQRFFSGELKEYSSNNDEFAKRFSKPPFDAIQQKLNPMLERLGLSIISGESAKEYEDNPQSVMDKYFNKPLERAYAEGKIALNKGGQLERNADYDIASEIADGLLDKNAGNFFKTGSIINQIISKRYFNLREEGKLGGQYTLKTGYIQLENGDYLSVKLIESKGRTVKAVKAELVSDKGRKILDAESLIKILEGEGYSDLKTETINESEQNSFINALKGKIEAAENPFAETFVMSAGSGKYAGKILIDADKNKIKEIIKASPEEAKKTIWVVPYTTPDDVEILNQVGAVVTLGGGYNSHAAISTRELGKMSMAVRALLRNGKLEMEFVKLKKGETRNINGIQIQDVESAEMITIEDGAKILLDSVLGQIELCSEEEFKKHEYSSETSRPAAVAVKRQGEMKPKKPLKELSTEEIVKTFEELKEEDKSRTGSKGWNLAEMLKKVFRGENIIPKGITVGQDGIRYYLGEKAEEFDKLSKEIRKIIGDNKGLKKERIEPFRKEIIALIRDTAKDIEKNGLIKEVLKKMEKLGIMISAVRSSGVGEDGQMHAFAGMGKSKAKVKKEKVPEAIAECFESFYSDRAIEYMIRSGGMVEPALVIQEWVDFAKSGVAMADGEIVTINGAYGECSAIVDGRVNPDNIVLRVKSYKTGEYEILEYETADKNWKVKTNEDGESKLTRVVQGRKQRIFTEKELKEIVNAIGKIKDEFKFNPDVEFGFDENNKLKVVQARPNTSVKETNDENITAYEFSESKLPLAATIFYKLRDLKVSNPLVKSIVNFVSNPFGSPVWETAYLVALSLINPAAGYLAFFASHIIADTLILKEGETRAEALKKTLKAHSNWKFIVGTIAIAAPFAVIGITPFAFFLSFIIHEAYNALAVKYGFAPADVLNKAETKAETIENIIDSYTKTAPEVKLKPEMLAEFAKHNAALSPKELRDVLNEYGSKDWFQELFSGNYGAAYWLTVDGLKLINYMISDLGFKFDEQLASFAIYNKTISKEFKNIVDKYKDNDKVKEGIRKLVLEKDITANVLEKICYIISNFDVEISENLMKSMRKKDNFTFVTFAEFKNILDKYKDKGKKGFQEFFSGDYFIGGFGARGLDKIGYIISNFDVEIDDSLINFGNFNILSSVEFKNIVGKYKDKGKGKEGFEELFSKYLGPFITTEELDKIGYIISNFDVKINENSILFGKFNRISPVKFKNIVGKYKDKGKKGIGELLSGRLDILSITAEELEKICYIISNFDVEISENLLKFVKVKNISFRKFKNMVNMHKDKGKEEFEKVLSRKYIIDERPNTLEKAVYVSSELKVRISGKLLESVASVDVRFTPSDIKNARKISEVLGIEVTQGMISCAGKINIGLLKKNKGKETAYHKIFSYDTVGYDTPDEVMREISQGKLSFKELVVKPEDAKYHNINDTSPESIEKLKLNLLAVKKIIDADYNGIYRLGGFFEIRTNYTLDELLENDDRLKVYTDEIIYAVSDIKKMLEEKNKAQEKQDVETLSGILNEKDDNDEYIYSFVRGRGVEYSLAMHNVGNYDLGDMVGDCTGLNFMNINRGMYKSRWLMDPSYEIFQVFIDGEFTNKFEIIKGEISSTGKQVIIIIGQEDIPQFRDGTSSLMHQRDIAYFKSLNFIIEFAKRNGFEEIYISHTSNSPHMTEKSKAVSVPVEEEVVPQIYIQSDFENLLSQSAVEEKIREEEKLLNVKTFSVSKLKQIRLLMNAEMFPDVYVKDGQYIIPVSDKISVLFKNELQRRAFREKLTLTLNFIKVNIRDIEVLGLRKLTASEKNYLSSAEISNGFNAGVFNSLDALSVSPDSLLAEENIDKLTPKLSLLINWDKLYKLDGDNYAAVIGKTKSGKPVAVKFMLQKDEQLKLAGKIEEMKEGKITRQDKEEPEPVKNRVKGILLSKEGLHDNGFGEFRGLIIGGNFKVYLDNSDEKIMIVYVGGKILKFRVNSLMSERSVYKGELEIINPEELSNASSEIDEKTKMLLYNAKIPSISTSIKKVKAIEVPINELTQSKTPAVSSDKTDAPAAKEAEGTIITETENAKNNNFSKQFSQVFNSFFKGNLFYKAFAVLALPLSAVFFIFGLPALISLPALSAAALFAGSIHIGGEDDIFTGEYSDTGNITIINLEQRSYYEQEEFVLRKNQDFDVNKGHYLIRNLPHKDLMGYVEIPGTNNGKANMRISELGRRVRNGEKVTIAAEVKDGVILGVVVKDESSGNYNQLNGADWNSSLAEYKTKDGKVIFKVVDPVVKAENIEENKGEVKNTITPPAAQEKDSVKFRLPSATRIKIINDQGEEKEYFIDPISAVVKAEAGAVITIHSRVMGEGCLEIKGIPAEMIKKSKDILGVEIDETSIFGKDIFGALKEFAGKNSAVTIAVETYYGEVTKVLAMKDGKYEQVWSTFDWMTITDSQRNKISHSEWENMPREKCENENWKFQGILTGNKNGRVKLPKGIDEEGISGILREITAKGESAISVETHGLKPVKLSVMNDYGKYEQVWSIPAAKTNKPQSKNSKQSENLKEDPAREKTPAPEQSNVSGQVQENKPQKPKKNPKVLKEKPKKAGNPKASKASAVNDVIDNGAEGNKNGLLSKIKAEYLGESLSYREWLKLPLEDRTLYTIKGITAIITSRFVSIDAGVLKTQMVIPDTPEFKEVYDYYNKNIPVEIEGKYYEMSKTKGQFRITKILTKDKSGRDKQLYSREEEELPITEEELTIRDSDADDFEQKEIPPVSAANANGREEEDSQVTAEDPESGKAIDFVKWRRLDREQRIGYTLKEFATMKFLKTNSLEIGLSLPETPANEKILKGFPDETPIMVEARHDEIKRSFIITKVLAQSGSGEYDKQLYSKELTDLAEQETSDPVQKPKQSEPRPAATRDVLSISKRKTETENNIKVINLDKKEGEKGRIISYTEWASFKDKDKGHWLFEGVEVKNLNGTIRLEGVAEQSMADLAKLVEDAKEKSGKEGKDKEEIGVTVALEMLNGEIIKVFLMDMNKSGAYDLKKPIWTQIKTKEITVKDPALGSAKEMSYLEWYYEHWIKMTPEQQKEKSYVLKGIFVENTAGKISLNGIVQYVPELGELVAEARRLGKAGVTAALEMRGVEIINVFVMDESSGTYDETESIWPRIRGIGAITDKDTNKKISHSEWRKMASEGRNKEGHYIIEVIGFNNMEGATNILGIREQQIFELGKFARKAKKEGKAAKTITVETEGDKIIKVWFINDAGYEQIIYQEVMITDLANPGKKIPHFKWKDFEDKDKGSWMFEVSVENTAGVIKVSGFDERSISELGKLVKEAKRDKKDGVTVKAETEGVNIVKVFVMNEKGEYEAKPRWTLVQGMDVKVVDLESDPEKELPYYPKWHHEFLKMPPEKQKEAHYMLKGIEVKEIKLSEIKQIISELGEFVKVAKHGEKAGETVAVEMLGKKIINVFKMNEDGTYDAQEPLLPRIEGIGTIINKDTNEKILHSEWKKMTDEGRNKTGHYEVEVLVKNSKGWVNALGVEEIRIPEQLGALVNSAKLNGKDGVKVTVETLNGKTIKVLLADNPETVLYQKISQKLTITDLTEKKEISGSEWEEMTSEKRNKGEWELKGILVRDNTGVISVLGVDEKLIPGLRKRVMDSKYGEAAVKIETEGVNIVKVFVMNSFGVYERIYQEATITDLKDPEKKKIPYSEWKNIKDKDRGHWRIERIFTENRYGAISFPEIVKRTIPELAKRIDGAKGKGMAGLTVMIETEGVGIKKVFVMNEDARKYEQEPIYEYKGRKEKETTVADSLTGETMLYSEWMRKNKELQNRKFCTITGYAAATKKVINFLHMRRTVPKLEEIYNASPERFPGGVPVKLVARYNETRQIFEIREVFMEETPGSGDYSEQLYPERYIEITNLRTQDKYKYPAWGAGVNVPDDLVSIKEGHYRVEGIFSTSLNGNVELPPALEVDRAIIDELGERVQQAIVSEGKDGVMISIETLDGKVIKVSELPEVGKQKKIWSRDFAAVKKAVSEVFENIPRPPKRYVRLAMASAKISAEILEILSKKELYSDNFESDGAIRIINLDKKEWEEGRERLVYPDIGKKNMSSKLTNELIRYLGNGNFIITGVSVSRDKRGTGHLGFLKMRRKISNYPQDKPTAAIVVRNKAIEEVYVKDENDELYTVRVTDLKTEIIVIDMKKEEGKEGAVKTIYAARGGKGGLGMSIDKDSVASVKKYINEGHYIIGGAWTVNVKGITDLSGIINKVKVPELSKYVKKDGATMALEFYNGKIIRAFVMKAEKGTYEEIWRNPDMVTDSEAEIEKFGRVLPLLNEHYFSRDPNTVFGQKEMLPAEVNVAGNDAGVADSGLNNSNSPDFVISEDEIREITYAAWESLPQEERRKLWKVTGVTAKGPRVSFGGASVVAYKLLDKVRKAPDGKVDVAVVAENKKILEVLTKGKSGEFDEREYPVRKIIITDSEGKRISDSDYKKLSPEQREKCTLMIFIKIKPAGRSATIEIDMKNLGMKRIGQQITTSKFEKLAEEFPDGIWTAVEVRANEIKSIHTRTAPGKYGDKIYPERKIKITNLNDPNAEPAEVFAQKDIKKHLIKGNYKIEGTRIENAEGRIKIPGIWEKSIPGLKNEGRDSEGGIFVTIIVRKSEARDAEVVEVYVGDKRVHPFFENEIVITNLAAAEKGEEKVYRYPAWSPGRRVPKDLVNVSRGYWKISGIETENKDGVVQFPKIKRKSGISMLGKFIAKYEKATMALKTRNGIVEEILVLLWNENTQKYGYEEIWPNASPAVHEAIERINDNKKDDVSLAATEIKGLTDKFISDRAKLKNEELLILMRYAAVREDHILANEIKDELLQRVSDDGNYQKVLVEAFGLINKLPPVPAYDFKGMRVDFENVNTRQFKLMCAAS
ncbi:MAG: PEP-utilizing enzyme [Endomicrobia bacterium]|nr:PEP-utilizing enzyme [Endomicrobiia bacterium]